MRFPAAPLLRLAELRLASSVDDYGPAWHAADTELAVLLGVDSTNIKKLRQLGLSRRQADRYAARLELHPVEIWPDFDQITAEEAAELDTMPELPRCAAVDCDNPVTPSRTGRRLYCSDRCKNRTHQRTYRATAKGKAAKAASNRRYKESQEVKRYIAKKRRERYWKDPEKERESRRIYYQATIEQQRERGRKAREERKAIARRRAMGPGWEEVA